MTATDGNGKGSRNTRNTRKKTGKGNGKREAIFVFGMILRGLVGAFSFRVLGVFRGLDFFLR